MARAPLRVAVATSGGRDSTALLHCTARWARAAGVEVIALHVNHGLVPQADDWQTRVRQQARRWGCAFAAARAEGAPARGDSVEAWARRRRYAALTRLAHDGDCDLVLLAQHRRDQAETFLIQALRGGGAAGLAAMPRVVQRDGITWARPWLDRPRTAIDAYLARHRLGAVDDPSNTDPRFARGRLRALWPALTDAFADVETTLSRAAERAAAEASLLAEVAARDLALVRVDAGALLVATWLSWSPPRRVNALRAWLAATLPEPVPDTLVRRLCSELPRCRRAEWPAGSQRLQLRGGVLRPTALRSSDTTDSGGSKG